MEYNIRLEFNLKPTEDSGDQLVTVLESFSPAAGPSDTNPNRTDVWVTVHATDALQAVDTARGLSGLVLGGLPAGVTLTALEVLPTVDFDHRAGITPVPELISSDEAAELLGVTRQAISKKFLDGQLPGHRVGERSIVFARRDIEGIASRR